MQTEASALLTLVVLSLFLGTIAVWAAILG